MFQRTALAILLAAPALALAQSQPVVGLITKTETNPFFVKMKEGAAEAAKAAGAKLLTGAGKTDGDNAGQVTAMENMIAAGAKTILITPSDAKAIVPAIKKARAKGVMVIALDSPTDPVDANWSTCLCCALLACELCGQFERTNAVQRFLRVVVTCTLRRRRRVASLSRRSVRSISDC